MNKAKRKTFRSSARWLKARDAALRSCPTCPDPFGAHASRVEPATSVHHIMPLITTPELATNQDNLQPLCAGCHSMLEARAQRDAPTLHLFPARLTRLAKQVKAKDLGDRLNCFDALALAVGGKGSLEVLTKCGKAPEAIPPTDEGGRYYCRKQQRLRVAPCAACVGGSHA